MISTLTNISNNFSYSHTIHESAYLSCKDSKEEEESCSRTETIVLKPGGRIINRSLIIHLIYFCLNPPTSFYTVHYNVILTQPRMLSVCLSKPLGW